MGYLKKIDSFFCKIQEYICILSGVFIAVTIICAAFMRYILKMNFGGSEELILFAAFWFYFMGSSLAFREDSHITADMSSLFFKNEKTQKYIHCVKYGISFSIALIALHWAFSFFLWSLDLWPTTAIYKLPITVSRLSILLSFILMAVYLLMHTIRSIAALKGGDPA